MGFKMRPEVVGLLLVVIAWFPGTGVHGAGDPCVGSFAALFPACQNYAPPVPTTTVAPTTTEKIPDMCVSMCDDMLGDNCDSAMFFSCPCPPSTVCGAVPPTTPPPPEPTTTPQAPTTTAAPTTTEAPTTTAAPTTTLCIMSDAQYQTCMELEEPCPKDPTLIIDAANMICEMEKTSKKTGLENQGIDCATCVTTPAPPTTTTTTIPPTTCPTTDELSGIAGYCYFDQANVDFSTCTEGSSDLYCLAGPLMTNPDTMPNLAEEPCHCVDMQAMDDAFGNPPKIGA